MITIWCDENSTNIMNYPFFLMGDLPFSDDCGINPRVKHFKNLMYGVYGFTKNKKILEEFRYQRREKMFHIRKIHMSSDEYNELKNQYDGFELKMYQYTSITVIGTEFEYQYVMDEYIDCIYEKFSNIGTMHYLRFNQEVRTSLELLCADIILSEDTADEFSMYEGSAWSYDMSSVFLELFGNTFKKGTRL